MYYDGANWKWDKENEMNLRFIERDGKKILQVAHDYHGYETWADVPCVEEKKEQRKLWQIIEDNFAKPNGYPETYKYTSRAAIDAVIECYELWRMSHLHEVKTFPEYLKEKLL